MLAGAIDEESVSELHGLVMRVCGNGQDWRGESVRVGRIG